MSHHVGCASESFRARRAGHGGFSLLEVIVALAILSTSTVLLLSIFSTAEKHAARAEERVRQQMLCLTLMDELLLQRHEIHDVEDEPLASDSNWRYSVEFTPTHIEGLMRLRVTVYRVRGVVNQQIQGQNESDHPRGSFQLVRWVKAPPSIDVMQGQTSFHGPASGQPPLDSSTASGGSEQ
jgi:prepilin-type N-terminal cleavage/methylation domain-containing protein